MATTRLRRSRASLGASWGDASYESDDGVSLHSASDLGSSSESEREDVPTPLPRRVVRASSRTPQTTPIKSTPRNSPSSQSSKYSNHSASHEPSFIMPASPNGYSTPLQEAKLQQRRGSRRYSGTSNMTPSPRHSVKRSPTQNLTSPKICQAEPDGPSYFWVLWENLIAPILTYVFGVLKIGLEQMKPFFAFLLILGVGVYLVSSGSRVIQSTLYNTLRPVCYLPFASSVLPFCSSGDRQLQEPAFEDLVKVQANFEDILHSSAHSFQLPVHMKLSEGSIRDVKNLVKHSKIPSKSELQVEMENFIDTARGTAEELTAFNSLIGRSVDKVLNTNRWTLQVLDGLEQQEAHAGALSRFFSSINPMNTFWPASTIQEKVFDQYVAHADVITAEINELIKRGEGVRRLLDYSSDLLDVIADIGARDGLKLHGDRDELFAKLWTKLGGNTRNVKQLNEQLNLLKRVTLSQNRAWNKVQETLLQLQRIRSGLDDLRERVAEPGVVGIKSNVPLRFYLDTIESGVDRLQEARGEARKIEHEGYRWALHEKDPKQLPKPPMKSVEPNF